ncbi:MAG: hypothetical protein R3B06_04960 [Kofleriaceae bacterium]
MLPTGVARRRKQILVGLAAIAALYLTALVVVGYAARGWVADVVRDRLALSLDGRARVGRVDLGLVRGRLALADVEVERDHQGQLRLAIARLEVDVAPLGAVVVDRAPRQITVRGARLAISGGGALGLPHRAGPPIAVGGVEIIDSELVIAATSALPGLAEVRVKLDRVRCGPTRFVTPMSWLFALDVLEARVELPGGRGFSIAYRDRVLTAVGGPFGQAPVTIDIELPRIPGDDEPAQVRAVAFSLGTKLVAALARGWLSDQLAPKPTTPAPAPAPAP